MVNPAVIRQRFDRQVTEIKKAGPVTSPENGRWRDFWSGIRDSNPRLSAWEADTLPTELIPPGSANAPAQYNKFARFVNLFLSLRFFLLHKIGKLVYKYKLLFILDFVFLK